MSENPTVSPPRVFRRDVIAWAVLFLASLLAFGGVHRWLHQRVVPSSGPRVAVSSDPRIAVLAYGRVVAEPDGVHLDAARLRDQLDALQREGFTPVTLNEVSDFYYRGQPLPARPLLLTFDRGYIETYEQADPILRSMRWRAVMFLITRDQQSRDTARLYWDRLQRMVDSGVWEVGSNGHAGPLAALLSAEDQQPEVLLDHAPNIPDPEAHREEWFQRLLRDYRASQTLIEGHLGRRAMAFADPFRNPFWLRDQEAYRANGEALAASYPLAFVGDRFGVNDRRSDPHRLGRLRVDPLWSGSQLVSRLSAALASPPMAGEHHRERTQVWSTATTPDEAPRDGVVLEGTPGSDAWVAGSRWADDWSLEADIKTEGGQFWVVQDAASPGEELRWGGDERKLYVERRHWGGLPEVLAEFDADVAPNRWHHVKLIKRSRGMWIEWDGRPLGDRPVDLKERSRGDVGWAAWRADGSARLWVAHVRFERVPFLTRVVGGEPSADEVQSLVRSAPMLAAVSPTWMQVTPEGGATESPVDPMAFSILSRRYGWEVLPTIRITGNEGSLSVPQIVARVEQERWAGIHLDLRDLPAGGRDRYGLFVEALARGLEQKGYNLVLSAADDFVPSPLSKHAPIENLAPRYLQLSAR